MRRVLEREQAGESGCHSLLKILSFQKKEVEFAFQNRKEKIPPAGLQSYLAYAVTFLRNFHSKYKD